MDRQSNRSALAFGLLLVALLLADYAGAQNRGRGNGGGGDSQPPTLRTGL